MDALVLGAGGLTGRELVKLLLEDPAFQKIKIIVRSKLAIEHQKLEQISANFSTIEAQKDKLKTDIIFSCLGSTKKKTPDLKEYYQIDHDYPLLVARLALEQGAKSFHLISSIYANNLSSMFYLKLNGETEQDTSALAYSIFHIYQPSLLTGERKEKKRIRARFRTYNADYQSIIYRIPKKTSQYSCSNHGFGHA